MLIRGPSPERRLNILRLSEGDDRQNGIEQRFSKKLPPKEGAELLNCASVTISRVLYWAIIYPDQSLPKGSSDRGKCGEQPTIPASCTGWGLQRGQVTRPAGELLPRLSILTEPGSAVYFCCTLPGVASAGR